VLRFDVAGARSGSGKTALLCRLLVALPGWGALKVAVHPPGRGHGPAGIVADPGTLAEPGTDTGRYLAAGAARVRWLRATPDTIAAVLPTALAAFEDLPGVLVEGNSSWRVAPGNRLVLVVRAEDPDWKPSALDLLDEADLVVAVPARPGGAGPTGTFVLPRSIRGEIVSADPWDRDDPGIARIVTTAITWSRG